MRDEARQEGLRKAIKRAGGIRAVAAVVGYSPQTIANALSECGVVTDKLYARVKEYNDNGYVAHNTPPRGGCGFYGQALESDKILAQIAEGEKLIADTKARVKMLRQRARAVIAAESKAKLKSIGRPNSV